MKVCLIAGNNPQYVINLPKEIHRMKLRGILRKYIGKLISSGVTEFYADADSEIKTAVEEVLSGFDKTTVNTAGKQCGKLTFSAVIAVWGC